MGSVTITEGGAISVGGVEYSLTQAKDLADEILDAVALVVERQRRTNAVMTDHWVETFTERSQALARLLRYASEGRSVVLRSIDPHVVSVARGLEARGFDVTVTGFPVARIVELVKAASPRKPMATRILVLE